MATGTNFVVFPFNTKYDWSGSLTQHVVKSNQVISYESPTITRPTVCKIGYSYGTHNYSCVIYPYGNIGSKDDVNTCAFTDDSLGQSAGFSVPASYFVGHSVYRTLGGNGTGGKSNTGLVVYQVYGAVANVTKYFDGVAQTPYSERMYAINGGIVKEYGGVYYAINVEESGYYLDIPSERNRTIVSVSGTSGSRNGNRWEFTAASDLNLSCYYASNFTVVFHSNHDTDATSTQSCVNVGTSNLDANSFTRDKYKFVKWNTSADGTGTDVANREALDTVFSNCSGTAGETIHLYAQWEYTAFNVTVTKQYVGGLVGVEQADIGTLSLVRTSDNATVVTEDATTHTFFYEGTANATGAANPIGYRVVCTMDDGKPDLLWTATGIADGGRVSGNVITPYEGDVISNCAFVFTKKATYSLALAYSTADKGTAAITSPSEADENGKYIAGRNLTIVATPATGYKLNRAVGTSAREFSNIQNNTIDYANIAQDEKLTLYFQKETYTASVEKDAASSSAISSVKVRRSNVQEWSETGIEEYDLESTVLLEATVESGYSFDGWYVGGVRQNLATTQSGSTYTSTYTGTGNKAFVAKAKVAVTLALSTRATGSTPAPSVLPDLNTTGITNGYVTLGNSFSYEIVARSWVFNAWFVTGTQPPSVGVPLAYGVSGTITPTAAMDITADLTSDAIFNTITVLMEDDEEGHSHQSLAVSGIITLTGDGVSGEWDSAQSKYVFTVTGTKSVTLRSSDVVPGTPPYSFSRFADASYVTLSNDSEYPMLSTTKTIRAMYMVGGPRTTTLGYAASGGVTGDRTMGTFEFVGVDSSALSNEGRTATLDVGTQIGISVKPNNGYRFAGWYTQQTVCGEPFLVGTDVTMVVATNRNLYACFVQDPNAVYIWEGSGDNKSFEWRSKTYVLSRPTNPSCCRVQTEGYPVIELDVDMFSAPDTSPTVNMRLSNVASQSSRRLPVARKERYLQICVKNDKEVDEVIVGTNMTELAQ